MKSSLRADNSAKTAQLLTSLYLSANSFFSPFHQPSLSISKPNTEDEATEPEEPNLLERMIEALHMELLFVRHRIAVKLANLGQGITGEISLKL